MNNHLLEQLAEIHARPGFLERVAAATPTPVKTPAVDLSRVWSRNPFSAQFRNLTEQMMIVRTDKALADRLKTEAEKLDAAL